jgi:hypothetical protein
VEPEPGTGIAQIVWKNSGIYKIVAHIKFCD